MRNLNKLALAILVISFLACDKNNETIVGSGNLVILPQQVSDFQAVAAAHGFQVTMTPADSFSVIVTCDDNIVDKLRIINKNGALELSLVAGTNTSNATLRADISMPFPKSLLASGGSRYMLNDGYKGGQISYVLSGGSRVEGSITATQSIFLLSGGSTIVLQGEGESATVNCSGGSTASLVDYSLRRCSVIASGGSTVLLNVSNMLDVLASGGSRVHYKGDPQLGEVNLSGGSKLERIP